MRPIDADALLEQIGIDSAEGPGYYGDTWQFIKTIENAPTLDMTSEWVPCSERLPSEQGQYLVTFPLCNGDPCAHVLSFCKGKFYETDDEWGDVEYDDVTAWMPLPKPYTADRKTEHRDCINCESADDCAKCRGFKDEPQTERSSE